MQLVTVLAAALDVGDLSIQISAFHALYYIGGAEGHEYPDLQVGDEVNPRPSSILSQVD